MAMMRTLLHTLDRALADPAHVLARVNQNFVYLRATGIFATALYAIIEPRALRMVTACAGHPAPSLAHPGPPIRVLDCERMVPLFITDLERVPLSDHTLHPGDRLLFYTDGITERQNRVGTMLGLERLIEALRSDACDAPNGLLRHVIEEIESFADG